MTGEADPKSDPRPDPRPDRWSCLREFVSRWYRDPLAEEPGDDYAYVVPQALREWFELAGDRARSGLLQFPTLLGTSHATSEDGRPLIRVLHDGRGSAGWAYDAEDADPDPEIHTLVDPLDVESSLEEQEFCGSLSELLTFAVISETLAGGFADGSEPEGPLGRLAAGVRRVSGEQLTPAVRDHLVGGDLTALAMTTPGGQWRLLTDPRGALLVLQERPWFEEAEEAWETRAALTRDPARWAEVERILQGAEQASHRAAEEAARAAEQELRGRLEALGGPGDGPGLVTALEAVEGRLLRFQRSFLADFRRAVAGGSATEGQLLRAAEMLRERGGTGG